MHGHTKSAFINHMMVKLAIKDYAGGAMLRAAREAAYGGPSGVVREAIGRKAAIPAALAFEASIPGSTVIAGPAIEAFKRYTTREGATPFEQGFGRGLVDVKRFAWKKPIAAGTRIYKRLRGIKPDVKPFDYAREFTGFGD